jgi:esterase/lipase
LFIVALTNQTYFISGKFHNFKLEESFKYMNMLNEKQVVNSNNDMISYVNIKTFENNDKCIIYLHGLTNILGSLRYLEILKDISDYDIINVDYRGFGKSSGYLESPNQYLDDCLSVYDDCMTNSGYKHVVVISNCLGCIPGAGLATYRHVDKLIMVNPFYSFKDFTYDMLNVNIFIRSLNLIKLYTPHIKQLSNLMIPVVIIRSENDISNIWQTKAIFNVLNDHRSFFVCKNVHHTNIFHDQMFIEKLINELRIV